MPSKANCRVAWSSGSVTSQEPVSFCLALSLWPLSFWARPSHGWEMLLHYPTPLRTAASGRRRGSRGSLSLVSCLFYQKFFQAASQKTPSGPTGQIRHMPTPNPAISKGLESSDLAYCTQDFPLSHVSHVRLKREEPNPCSTGVQVSVLPLQPAAEPSTHILCTDPYENTVAANCWLHICWNFVCLIEMFSPPLRISLIMSSYNASLEDEMKALHK